MSITHKVFFETSREIGNIFVVKPKKKEYLK